MSRMIAIQWINENAIDNVLKLVKDFNAYGFEDNIILFGAKDVPAFVEPQAEGLKYAYVQVPYEKDEIPKIKNFILSYFEQQEKYDGFLHMLEDNIVLDKNPLDYIENLAHTMSVLDYGIYFSTITDPCNYVFNKFSPRLTISIDDESIQNKLHLPKSLSFTSHSNTAWVSYDFSKVENIQKYDEKFTIAMFYIIEYLARRKATKKANQLYFMNQYLSISNEIGVFHTIDIDKNQLDPKKMQEEDALFKSMNIDYAPDNNIDVILDSLYDKIKEKIN